MAGLEDILLRPLLCPFTPLLSPQSDKRLRLLNQQSIRKAQHGTIPLSTCRPFGMLNVLLVKVSREIIVYKCTSIYFIYAHIESPYPKIPFRRTFDKTLARQYQSKTECSRRTGHWILLLLLRLVHIIRLLRVCYQNSHL